MKYPDSGRISINPPPNDLRCEECHRHVDELESLGEPDELVDGDAAGTKLAEIFREDYPGCIVPRWECRDCIGSPYSLWENYERKRLGRDLMPEEYRQRRQEIEEAMELIHTER